MVRLQAGPHTLRAIALTPHVVILPSLHQNWRWIPAAIPGLAAKLVVQPPCALHHSRKIGCRTVEPNHAREGVSTTAGMSASTAAGVLDWPSTATLPHPRATSN
jgi:hypothetical protein